MNIKITGYPDKQIKFKYDCEELHSFDFERRIRGVLKEHLNQFFIFSLDTSNINNERIKKDMKKEFINLIFQRNVKQFIFKIGTKTNFDVDYLKKKENKCFCYIY